MALDNFLLDILIHCSITSLRIPAIVCQLVVYSSICLFSPLIIFSQSLLMTSMHCKDITLINKTSISVNFKNDTSSSCSEFFCTFRLPMDKARLIAVSPDAQSFCLIFFCLCSLTGGFTLIFFFALVTGNFGTGWSFASRNKTALGFYGHIGSFPTITLKTFFDILVRGVLFLLKVKCLITFYKSFVSIESVLSLSFINILSL